MTTSPAPAAAAAEALELCEKAILSVLRLWPRGAAEAAVAHRAGLDAATAAAALRRLRDAGWVVSSEPFASGRRKIYQNRFSALRQAKVFDLDSYRAAS